MNRKKKIKELNLKIGPQDIESDVLWIINKLKEADYEALLVGGCIRNLIMGRAVQDWDITTNASLDEIFRVFKNCKLVPVGKRFGTVTLVLNKTNYEVSTFKGRKLKNKTEALKEDLSHRDFTINTLVWDQGIGLMDYLGGINDLQQGIIRGVINPAKRIKEDPLRMLRGIRLAGELDFKIEEITWREIKKYSSLLRKVSIERIRDELVRLLTSNSPGQGFQWLQEADLLRYILPELELAGEFCLEGKDKKISLFDYISGLLEELPSDLVLRISALLKGVKVLETLRAEKDLVSKILYRLKFKNSIIKKVKILLQEEGWETDLTSPAEIRKIISQVGEENIYPLLALRKADLKIREEKTKLIRMKKVGQEIREILKQKPPLSLVDLAINGTDLIGLGYPEGKEMGEVLQRLLRLVLVKPELNQRDTLIELVEKKH